MLKFISLALGPFILVLSLFSIAHAEFALMLGSFRYRDNAQSYMHRFAMEEKDLNKKTFIERVQLPQKPLWFRVCVGPFESRDEAVRAQKILQASGQDSVVVSTKTSRNEAATIQQPAADNGFESQNIHKNAKKVQGNPPLISPEASNGKLLGSHKDSDPKNRDLSAGSRAVSHGVSKTGEVVTNDSESEGTVLVMPGDVLNIEIPTQKQMSQNYDVDPEGRIFMLSVGEVMIGGLNLEMAQKKISMLLRQLIPKEEKPLLRLVESMRYVQIVGGVAYPGWYHVSTLSNLDELVEMAGGLAAGVDFSEIKIRRKKKGGFRDLRARAQVSLEPNDVLLVPTPKEYERAIDSGDLLFINIPEKSSETNISEIEKRVVQNQIQVDKAGYIYIPDYGHIYVKNLLPKEVAKIITNRLPKYLARSAKVHVNIIEKRQYVQIVGHVAKPGWYNIPEADNIQGALSAAGGAVDGSIMSRVTVTRKWGGEVHKVRVNLYQFTVTGDVRLLTPIHENDSIFVPISAAFGDVKRTLSAWMPPPSRLEEETGSKVRIFGAVVNPGTYETKEDMSILDLLILAGGNRDDADLAKTLLIRENKTVAYDLNNLIIQSTQGAAKIPKVQNGDSVYVSFVKKAGYEKQEPKKMIRIFGAVKKPGIYEASPNMNIVDVFSLANGQTYDADLKKINIARVNGEFEKLDLQEYFDAKDPDPTRLPIVHAGDTVYVHYLQHLNLEKKEPIYLLGKVKSPGQYQLASGGMTVYQMLAYAGGLDEWADTENILIIRMVNGRQRNIAYNLRKALSGKYPELNIRLRSFDTIYVP